VVSKHIKYYILPTEELFTYIPAVVNTSIEDYKVVSLSTVHHAYLCLGLETISVSNLRIIMVCYSSTMENFTL